MIMLVISVSYTSPVVCYELIYHLSLRWKEMLYQVWNMLIHLLQPFQFKSKQVKVMNDDWWIFHWLVYIDFYVMIALSMCIYAC